MIRHGPALAEFDGLYAFYRSRAPLVSVPADRFNAITSAVARMSAADVSTPARFAVAITSVTKRVAGPTLVAYGDRGTLAGTDGPARMLTREDYYSIPALRTACSDDEWVFGDDSMEEVPAAGIFEGSQLVALAGYRPLANVIAQIAVITHPRFRQRGFGRSATATVAQHAIKAGLIPQLRGADSNTAAIRLGQSLGFQPYATVVTGRFS